MRWPAVVASRRGTKGVSVADDTNLNAYLAAIDAFNKKGDLSAVIALEADDMVHHNASPGVEIVGKQQWAEAATAMVEKGGWIHHEILSSSAADEFVQVVARNTFKSGRSETFAGTMRFRAGKIAEVWSVGHHPS